MNTAQKIVISIMSIVILAVTSYFLVVFLAFRYPCPSCPVAENTLLIDSDSDFEKFDFQGSGTAEDPYFIENLILGTNETWLKETYTALEISFTSKHFVVRNCTILGGNYGLKITSIADNTCLIENCTFVVVFQTPWDNPRAMGGLLIKDSDGVRISNNTHYGNNEFLRDYNLNHKGNGLMLENSDNCLIENSFFFCEILLVNSMNAIIRNNTHNSDYYVEYVFSLKLNSDYNPYYFSHGTLKILLSNNITICNNSISASDRVYGILIVDSNQIQVDNNTIDIREIALIAYNSTSLFITNNTVYRMYNESLPFEFTDCFNVYVQDNIIHDSIISIPRMMKEDNKGSN